MRINKYLIIILLSVLLTGCGSSPIYIDQETESLPNSRVALMYRDGIDGGKLMSIDGIKIPYNAWAPSPVYIKKGGHNVEYIKWDYFSGVTKANCLAGSGCKYTTERTTGTNLKLILEKCFINVEGGKVYSFSEVGKLLRTSGCETNIGFIY